MKVFLIRHAKALDAGAGRLDENRTLSEEGRKQVRTYLAPILQDAGVEEIHTSPVARALQTAEVIASETKNHENVYVTEALRLGAKPDAIVNLLDRLLRRDLGCVALVAHEPTIGQFIRDCMGAVRRVKKGTAVCFSWPSAEIRYYTTKRGNKV